MHLIQYNFVWMSFNIFLAILPIVLGWIFLFTKNKYLKTIIGFFWLIFLPNSIYLFTDLINLMRQWILVGPFERLVFIFQYSVLIIVGFVTSILALYPLEKFLNTLDWVKKNGGTDRYLIVLNFIIGFGITLGRTERVNSWEIIADPISIVYSTFNIITKPELIILTILFGLFANFFYFLFRKSVVNYARNCLIQAGFLK
ncbi:MAG TPA: DUF1361 domain-containing protein [Candidatus Limnocylindrales bacterium]|nr:DUF1361 domain-containing protein [Candidatus Limnocylindrales bacterium]